MVGRYLHLILLLIEVNFSYNLTWTPSDSLEDISACKEDTVSIPFEYTLAVGETVFDKSWIRDMSVYVASLSSPTGTGSYINRVTTSGTATISIENLKPEETGVYRAVIVINPGLIEYTATATVTIYDPDSCKPTYHEAPNDDKTCHLTCILPSAACGITSCKFERTGSNTLTLRSKSTSKALLEGGIANVCSSVFTLPELDCAPVQVSHKVLLTLAVICVFASVVIVCYLIKAIHSGIKRKNSEVAADVAMISGQKQMTQAQLRNQLVIPGGKGTEYFKISILPVVFLVLFAGSNAVLLIVIFNVDVVDAGEPYRFGTMGCFLVNAIIAGIVLLRYFKVIPVCTLKRRQEEPVERRQKEPVDPRMVTVNRDCISLLWSLPTEHLEMLPGLEQRYYVGMKDSTDRLTGTLSPNESVIFVGAIGNQERSIPTSKWVPIESKLAFKHEDNMCTIEVTVPRKAKIRLDVMRDVMRDGIKHEELHIGHCYHFGVFAVEGLYADHPVVETSQPIKFGESHD